MTKSRLMVLSVLALSLASSQAYADAEQKSLEELRNTVINLLQALVDQKVISSEQANHLVEQAQQKAAKDASTTAAKDAGAVHVTYVPQIVKDEISRQVASQVEPKVVQDVMTTAKSEGWGVPAGLPEWIKQVRATGDVRVRFQDDLFGHGNLPYTVPDYNSINAAGGITQAGLNAFLNTTNDTERLRLRARFGLEARLLDSWYAAVRLSTGGALDPSSESQTFGTTAARYTVGIDQGYIQYKPMDSSGYGPVTLTFGRMPSPWATPTELLFARDLSFEGVAATGRLRFGSGPDAQGHNSFGYLTAGAFPIQQVPLNHSGNKWLVAGQLGSDLWLDRSDRLRINAGYFDFVHVTGLLNPPGLSIYNFSAPPFIRYGNTYFDIANSLTGTNNLYALAGKFRVADVSVSYDHMFGRYTLSVTGDAVKNIGYKASDVYARTGIDQATRNRGYVGEVGFGDMDAAARRGAWRTTLGYRYAQRDAVLDAWTDSDFHGGGTNARGLYFIGDLGLTPGVFLRVRYMNADTIDGPAPFSEDSIQVDLNARF